MECSIVKSKHVDINIADFEQIKYDVFSTDFINFTEKEANNFRNLTSFHNCVNELNVIQNGLVNFDEWAVKSKSI